MTHPKETAGELAKELASLFGPRLRSVVLHGSVAREEAIPGVSDINLLVLLDTVDPAALRIGSPVARRWVQAGNTAPFLASWHEWEESADAFAIELADMRDAHVVLSGADPITHLPADPAALRLQAERELRGKLIQLRTGLLLAADQPEQIGNLLLRALPSFTTYFRAILRLNGRTPPARSEEVIDEAGRLARFDPAPLQRAWEARRAGQPVKLAVEDPLTVGYYAAAARATEYVDSFSEERPA